LAKVIVKNILPRFFMVHCVYVYFVTVQLKFKNMLVTGWKTPCAEIGQFLTGVHMRKAIHVCCFKNGRNQCTITKKQNTFWHPGAEPLRRFPPFFLCECAPCPVTYIRYCIHIGSVFRKLVT